MQVNKGHQKQAEGQMFLKTRGNLVLLHQKLPELS